MCHCHLKQKIIKRIRANHATLMVINLGIVDRFLLQVAHAKLIHNNVTYQLPQRPTSHSTYSMTQRKGKGNTGGWSANVSAMQNNNAMNNQKIIQEARRKEAEVRKKEEEARRKEQENRRKQEAEKQKRLDKERKDIERRVQAAEKKEREKETRESEKTDNRRCLLDLKEQEKAKIKHDKEVEAARRKQEKDEESAKKRREKDIEVARMKHEKEIEINRKNQEKEKEMARKRQEKEADAARKQQEKETNMAQKKQGKEIETNRKNQENEIKKAKEKREREDKEERERISKQKERADKTEIDEMSKSCQKHASNDRDQNISMEILKEQKRRLKETLKEEKKKEREILKEDEKKEKESQKGNSRDTHDQHMSRSRSTISPPSNKSHNPFSSFPHTPTGRSSLFSSYKTTSIASVHSLDTTQLQREPKRSKSLFSKHTLPDEDTLAPISPPSIATAHTTQTPVNHALLRSSTVHAAVVTHPSALSRSEEIDKGKKSVFSSLVRHGSLVGSKDIKATSQNKRRERTFKSDSPVLRGQNQENEQTRNTGLGGQVDKNNNGGNREQRAKRKEGKENNAAGSTIHSQSDIDNLPNVDPLESTKAQGQAIPNNGKRKGDKVSLKKNLIRGNMQNLNDLNEMANFDYLQASNDGESRSRFRSRSQKSKKDNHSSVENHTPREKTQDFNDFSDVHNLHYLSAIPRGSSDEASQVGKLEQDEKLKSKSGPGWISKSRKIGNENKSKTREENTFRSIHDFMDIPNLDHLNIESRRNVDDAGQAASEAKDHNSKSKPLSRWRSEPRNEKKDNNTGLGESVISGRIKNISEVPHLDHLEAMANTNTNGKKPLHHREGDQVKPKPRMISMSKFWEDKQNNKPTPRKETVSASIHDLSDMPHLDHLAALANEDANKHQLKKKEKDKNLQSNMMPRLRKYGNERDASDKKDATMNTIQDFDIPNLAYLEASLRKRDSGNAAHPSHRNRDDPKSKQESTEKPISQKPRQGKTTPHESAASGTIQDFNDFNNILNIEYLEAFWKKDNLAKRDQKSKKEGKNEKTVSKKPPRLQEKNGNVSDNIRDTSDTTNIDFFEIQSAKGITNDPSQPNAQSKKSRSKRVQKGAANAQMNGGISDRRIRAQNSDEDAGANKKDWANKQKKQDHTKPPNSSLNNRHPNNDAPGHGTPANNPPNNGVPRDESSSNGALTKNPPNSSHLGNGSPSNEPLNNGPSSIKATNENSLNTKAAEKQPTSAAGKIAQRFGKFSKLVGKKAKNYNKDGDKQGAGLKIEGDIQGSGANVNASSRPNGKNQDQEQQGEAVTSLSPEQIQEQRRQRQAAKAAGKRAAKKEQEKSQNNNDKLPQSSIPPWHNNPDLHLSEEAYNHLSNRRAAIADEHSSHLERTYANEEAKRAHHRTLSEQDYQHQTARRAAEAETTATLNETRRSEKEARRQYEQTRDQKDVQHRITQHAAESEARLEHSERQRANEESRRQFQHTQILQDLQSRTDRETHISEAEAARRDRKRDAQAAQRQYEQQRASDELQAWQERRDIKDHVRAEEMERRRLEETAISEHHRDQQLNDLQTRTEIQRILAEEKTTESDRRREHERARMEMRAEDVVRERETRVRVVEQMERERRREVDEDNRERKLARARTKVEESEIKMQEEDVQRVRKQRREQDEMETARVKREWEREEKVRRWEDEDAERVRKREREREERAFEEERMAAGARVVMKNPHSPPPPPPPEDQYYANQEHYYHDDDDGDDNDFTHRDFPRSDGGDYLGPEGRWYMDESDEYGDPSYADDDDDDIVGSPNGYHHPLEHPAEEYEDYSDEYSNEEEYGDYPPPRPPPAGGLYDAVSLDPNGMHSIPFIPPLPLDKHDDDNADDDNVIPSTVHSTPTTIPRPVPPFIYKKAPNNNNNNTQDSTLPPPPPPPHQQQQQRLTRTSTADVGANATTTSIPRNLKNNNNNLLNSTINYLHNTQQQHHDDDAIIASFPDMQSSSDSEDSSDDEDDDDVVSERSTYY
ncbi:hypothetical protein DM02DRAFT_627159 [Periconia macrospinosa]|uniref:Uncharacterized protein n=1 Tax=Periconia macrospinosa TaxID=97972 RepID=A0A2V1DXH7_9PLEO|nr:hypothetical protein DM02DRAFT_627159 [Periconia macrospinosa]